MLLMATTAAGAQQSDVTQIVDKGVEFVRGRFPTQSIFVAADLLSADSLITQKVARDLGGRRGRSTEVFACWEAAGQALRSCAEVRRATVLAIGRPMIDGTRAVMTLSWRALVEGRGVFAESLTLELRMANGTWSVYRILRGTVS
jgi:hypothetical protein